MDLLEQERDHYRKVLEAIARGNLSRSYDPAGLAQIMVDMAAEALDEWSNER